MDEWVWSNGGMILREENWSTGRKTLYSVGGRWMNEHGAMVEWYWQGKIEVLGEKPVPVLVCTPQIPNVHAWDRTRVFTKRVQRLLASVTPRSLTITLALRPHESNWRREQKSPPNFNESPNRTHDVMYNCSPLILLTSQQCSSSNYSIR